MVYHQERVPPAPRLAQKRGQLLTWSVIGTHVLSSNPRRTPSMLIAGCSGKAARSSHQLHIPVLLRSGPSGRGREAGAVEGVPRADAVVAHPLRGRRPRHGTAAGRAAVAHDLAAAAAVVPPPQQRERLRAQPAGRLRSVGLPEDAILGGRPRGARRRPLPRREGARLKGSRKFHSAAVSRLCCLCCISRLVAVQQRAVGEEGRVERVACSQLHA